MQQQETCKTIASDNANTRILRRLYFWVFGRLPEWRSLARARFGYPQNNSGPPKRQARNKLSTVSQRSISEYFMAASTIPSRA